MMPIFHLSQMGFDKIVDSVKDTVDYLSTHHVVWETVGKGLGYMIKKSMEQPMPDVWNDTVGKALEQAVKTIGGNL